MADISVSKEHGMDLDAAKKKAHLVVDGLKQSMDYVKKVDWNADGTVATVKGKGFSGIFNVDSTKVGVDIDLTFLAKPFKGKIAEKVEARMDEQFG